MNRPPAPQPQGGSAARLAAALKSLLYAPDALSETGAGLNLAQLLERTAVALEQHTLAVRELTAVIRRWQDS
jgi:hypothetical protein